MTPAIGQTAHDGVVAGETLVPAAVLGRVNDAAWRRVDARFFLKIY